MKKILLIASSFVLITSAQAQFNWVKTVGGSDKDHVNGLAYDNAGHVYLTGHISDNADMDPSAGTYNLTYGSRYNDAEMFVAKYDTSGNIVWAFNTPGLNSNSDGMDIAFDPAGFVYVLSDAAGGVSNAGLVDWDPGAAVVTVPHNFNTNDVVLAKYDTTGNLVWVQLVVSKSTFTNVSYANGLALDNTGNIYITGQYSQTVDMDPSGATFNITAVGGKDIYFAKYSSAGALVWAHSIGGSGDDEGQGIHITPNNDVYLFGHFQGTNVDFDVKTGTTNLTSVGGYVSAFYAKYDTSASILTAYGIEGLSDFIDVKVDGSGNVVGGGFFSGTIDIDPSAGVTNITSGVTGSSYDHFLVKYSPAGALVFGYGFPSTAFALQEEGEILIDANDNIYFGGNFSGTVDYSGGFSTGLLTSTGTIDLAIAKYSPTGSLYYAYNIGATTEQMREFVLTGNELFIVGDVRGNTNFDPCGGTANAGSPEYDIFMLKINEAGCNVTTSIIEDDNIANIKLYPNPVLQGINLTIEVESLNLTQGNFQVSVIDLLGKEVFNSTFNQANNISINTDKLSGVYLVNITQGNKTYHSKIIVQ